MQPGIYMAGRSLHATNKANHQFIVLVPSKVTTLNKVSRMHSGTRFVLLGAYAGPPPRREFLRASSFAGSDESKLRRYIDSAGKRGAELNFAEVQACLVDPDSAIVDIYKCYLHYKTFEGKKNELRYPSFTEQFDSSKFNSNSWANSCVFWGCSRFGVKKNSDFTGIDIGDNRLIPREYFLR